MPLYVNAAESAAATRRIVSLFKSANADDLAYGLGWYQTAHEFCLSASERHGVTVETAAAIVAVLSPRTEWQMNLRQADAILGGGTAPTFFRTLAKCAALLAADGLADPLDVTYSGTFAIGGVERVTVNQPALGGTKVRSFYDNILRPSTSEAVTVDRHAWDVVDGAVGTDDSRRGLERVGTYSAITARYVAAARILGLMPHQVQAVTWSTWKRTKSYDRPQHTALYQARELVAA